MLNLNHLKLIIVAYFLLALPLSAQDIVDTNRLIDVSTLAQLNAIRYDLDGNGEPTNDPATTLVDEAALYRTAFSISGAGNNTCTGGTCQGYELINDLDFNDADGAGAGTTASVWAAPTAPNQATSPVSGGWEPIGDGGPTDSPRDDNPFTTTFEGNGHTISNLYISTTGIEYAGLFGFLRWGGAAIRNLGLEGGSVTSTADGSNVGSLVGGSRGTISACYSTVDVTGGTAAVGGLVGFNQHQPFERVPPTISACYATGDVTGGDTAAVGGLVGLNSGGRIRACYAIGSVSATGDYAAIGGLIGLNHQGSSADSEVRASYSTGSATGRSSAAIGGLIGRNERGRGSNGVSVNCYFNSETSGRANAVARGPTTGSAAKTTAQLQYPTAYAESDAAMGGTAIYSAWNVDIGGTSAVDNPWDFGTANSYPKLKVDFDGNSRPTATEFGPQHDVLPSPTITEFQDNVGNALSPTATAAIGDIVKIIGTNFSTTEANNTITVGGATATLTSATADELTFTVPLTASLGMGKIRVTVLGAASHVEEAFTITLPSPTITRFEDAAAGTITSALRGATVKIIGTNFSTTPANNTITVGGATATPTNTIATELTFTVPLTATLGLGQIRVTVSGAANYVESPFTITTKVVFVVPDPPDADVTFTGASGTEKAKYVVTKTLDEVDESGDVVLTLNVDPSVTTAYAYVDMAGADADAPTGLVSPIPASGAISTTAALAVTSSATVFYVQATQGGNTVIAKVELSVKPIVFAAPSPVDADVAFTGASGTEKAKYVVTKTLDEVDAIGDVVLTLNVAPSVTTAYAYVDMDGTLLAGPPTGLAATINTNGTISTDAALAVTSSATVFYVQATQGANTVIAKVELSVKLIVFVAPDPPDTDVVFTGASGTEKAKYVVTKTLDEVDASGDVVLTLNVAPSGTTAYAYVDMDGTLLAGPPTGLAATINTNGTISTDAALAVTSTAAVFYVQATQAANFVIAKVELTVNAAPALAFAEASTSDTDVAFTGAMGAEKAKYVVTKTLDEVDASGDVVLTLNVDPSGTTAYAYVDMDGALTLTPPSRLVRPIPASGAISTTAALVVTSSAAVFYVQATQGGNTAIAKVELTVNAAATTDFLGLTNLAHDLVSLYPNPASDKVYVSGLKSGDVYIYEIYSFLGQKVGTGQLSEGPSIDLKGLSAGAYVLILRSESGEEVFRSRCLISK